MNTKMMMIQFLLDAISVHKIRRSLQQELAYDSGECIKWLHNSADSISAYQRAAEVDQPSLWLQLGQSYILANLILYRASLAFCLYLQTLQQQVYQGKLIKWGNICAHVHKSGHLKDFKDRPCSIIAQKRTFEEKDFKDQHHGHISDGILHIYAFRLNCINCNIAILQYQLHNIRNVQNWEMVGYAIARRRDGEILEIVPHQGPAAFGRSCKTLKYGWKWSKDFKDRLASRNYLTIPPLCNVLVYNRNTLAQLAGRRLQVNTELIQNFH